MDRSPFPPPVHSQSTSAIPRPSSGPAADDDAAGAVSPGPLQRGYSDGYRPAVPAPPETFEQNTGARAIVGAQTTSGSDGSPAMASEASDSVTADRKRRLTTAESPDRRGGYRSAVDHGPSAAAPGSSQDTAIDLTGSPAWRHRETGRRSSNMEPVRRSSDLMIPPWQPDSEVAHCPVCGTQFSFWYRKHHCRKCGRVVCANCSPHRITIPRQYIVRAPDELRIARNIIDLTGEDEGHAARYDLYFNPALGGGEEVRVCNPCVPDPNLSPPPRQASSQFPAFDSSGFPDHFGQSRFSTLQPSGRSRNMTYDSTQGLRQQQYSHHRQTLSDVSQRSTDPFRSARVSFHGRTTVSDLFPPPPPPNGAARASPGSSPFPSYQNFPSSSYPHFSHHMRPSRSSSASSGSNQPSRYRYLPGDTHTPPYPISMHHSPQPPRRQIPEEDECPVCHEELPARGPDGSTVAREAHVEQCIAANFAGPSSTPRPAAASPAAAIDAAVAASAAHPSDAQGPSSVAQNTPTPPPQAEGSQRRRRHTQGMLRYRATEKDCTDEKGDAQECIICFEDFHEGDEMGRLECFCKFHRACIRQWWDTKGDGSCPTHQGGFVLGG